MSVKNSLAKAFNWKSSKSLQIALSMVLCLGTAVSASVPPPPVDNRGSNFRQEAIGYLCDYIKIDTTNPPGNERLGANYLASILRKNGIAASLIDIAPGRSCVYARLKGTGKKRPIILLSHIDVVPANALDWKYKPFSGQIHEGEIWGRGAIDMKSMAIAELEAMLLAKRSQVKLDRDIIFLATPDEEMGGLGASFIVKQHPELVKDAEYLLNEGFHIDTSVEGVAQYWGVDISEKSVLWLKLTAKGQAGHASMPIGDSANNRLVEALNKIVTRPASLKILPAVNEYFRQIAKIESGSLASAYADIASAVKDKQMLAMLSADKLRYSMLQNTTSLTVLKSGYKTNVIPAMSEAQLDCRLLPGTSDQEFIADLKAVINDPAVEISVLDWQSTQASPYKSELFDAIAAVAMKETPNIPVVPMVVPWFTDCHWFRSLGIISYGFEPFKVDPKHLATMHGKNERIPVKEFADGVERLYAILKTVAGHNQ